jgi:hypothetical protein
VNSLTTKDTTVHEGINRWIFVGASLPVFFDSSIWNGGNFAPNLLRAIQKLFFRKAMLE